MNGTVTRSKWALIAAGVAVVFGALTVVSGASVLFGAETTRAAAGDVVAFVLWFNILSGFAYVLAGAGLFLWRRWGAQLSALLAIAILLVFGAFGVHVAAGGAFEMRTVAAMILRGGLWIAIAIGACRAFNCFKIGMSASDMPMNGRTR